MHSCTYQHRCVLINEGGGDGGDWSGVGRGHVNVADEVGWVVIHWAFKDFHGPYCVWIILMGCFEQLVGVDVGQGFPAIMCFGEPFPSDEVLYLIAPMLDS